MSSRASIVAVDKRETSERGLVSFRKEGGWLILTNKERRKLKRFVDVYILDQNERDELFDLLDGTGTWEVE